MLISFSGTLELQSTSWSTMLLRFLVILVILVSCHASKYPFRFRRSTLQGLKSYDSSAYKLPSTLKPTFYNLTLMPVNQTMLKGSVQIYVDVERETDSVVLNIFNKTIISSSLKVHVASQVKKFQVTETVVDGINDFVTFKLNEPLIEQKGVILTVSYLAFIPSDAGEGFYSINIDRTDETEDEYEDEDDAEAEAEAEDEDGAEADNISNTDSQPTLMITQFEPISARRAFPCFDEPRFRTPFQMTIYRLPGQASLFNTRLMSSTPAAKGPWIVDVYEPSLPMPSYLVAFGVTDYANISDGGQVRLFARDSIMSNMRFALSVAQPVLDALVAYTGVPYPWPKMDMVAEYSKGGAMENCGLVTFGENTLRYDPETSNPMEKYAVVSIIAHEFAHQWFGGVTVMERWEYLWLNEGFATYLSYKIVEILYPGWRLLKGKTAYTLIGNCLAFDVGNPRAMTSSAGGSGKEDNYFDYISYDKAGSVLHMTENFLTTKVWQSGLNIFLTRNMLKTVTPEKLFSALQEAANEIGLHTVNETLQGWTRNPGYPLVTITRDSVTSDGKVRYRITQAPYQIRDKSANYSWNVPLTYTTDKKREFDPAKADKHWLYPSDPSTSELVVDTTGWVLFNVERVGYYRVNYDVENWRKLKDQLLLNLTSIPEVSRAQLVDDALHLADSGHLNSTETMSFLRILINEKASQPWKSVRRFMYKSSDDETGAKKPLLKYLRFIYHFFYRQTQIMEYDDETN